MKFGVYLPTYAWRDLGFDQAARVKTFARRAEELGFDALWVAEHFLEAPGLYGTVWMSPLLCLAQAASVTTDTARVTMAARNQSLMRYLLHSVRI